jgi:hypothetical protein
MAATSHVEVRKRNGNRTVDEFDTGLPPEDRAGHADLLRRKAAEWGWPAGTLKLVVYGGPRAYVVEV